VAVGLIGLGLVGQALARRRVDAGHEVVGCDPDAEAADRAREIGVRIAATPAEVAGQCPVLLLSLPDSPVVDRVLWGPDGIVAAAASGSTVIDTTTADPAETVRHHERLAAAAIDFIDAPFVGSSAEILAGEALVLVGCEAPGPPALAPLHACGRDLRFMGRVGQGHRAKLIANLVLGLNRLVLAEGLGLAERCGMDGAQILDILRSSGARSTVMDTKGKKMLGRAFEPPVARLAQHAKDVRLIRALAAEVGAHVPASALHAELLDEAIARGWGALDNAAVMKLFTE
jgi:3-hydroxyisobutyrate dehydrogenase-like beta-hydroxyacid dehydrogenase